MKRAIKIFLAVGLVTGGVSRLTGCGVPTDGIPSGGDGSSIDGSAAGGGDGSGDAGTGDDDGGGDGSGDGGSGTVDTSEPVTGDYDPSAAFVLESGGLTLTVPPGATLTPVTLSVQSAAVTSLPGTIPGAVGLAGGSFGPDGQQFVVPVQAVADLSVVTIARALPVLTFDDARKRWVGTGEVASVGTDGSDVAFALDHFSFVGVPDPLPTPLPGVPIDALVTVPNTGTFSSGEINSDTATLFFSESGGGALVIDVTSQTVDTFGQVTTATLHLFAVAVSRVDNYVVAEAGGEGSYFSDGDFRSPDEQVVGTMVMSMTGGTVTVTVYVATPERVIFGTLIGQAG